MPGVWRLGGQSEVREDLAHHDVVGELCDEEAGAAEVWAGVDVDGKDAPPDLAHVERDERERADVLCALCEPGAKAAFEWAAGTGAR